MILRGDLLEVGQLFKPHGIKGEMSAELDYGLEPADVRCFLIEIDGIFVPFFVAESRRRGSDSWLIRLDGVNDEKQAMAFVNTTLYAVKAELPEEILEDTDEEGVHLYDLVGYTLCDEASKSAVGVITAIDDSTANVLMSIEAADGDTLLVPFAEELVTALDTENKSLTLELPQGLTDLN